MKLTVAEMKAILEGNTPKPVKPRLQDSGYFDVKAGTTRRSRKGRTYRLANGYARFVPDWDNLRNRDYWG